MYDEAYKGNLEDGFVFTGANDWLIDKITLVSAIINELTKE